MPFRSIAIAAGAGILLVVLLHLLVLPSLDTDGRFWLNAGSRIAMLAMVTVAAGMAANQFDWWSEHFGRAWTLFFVEYGLLTFSEIIDRGFPDLSVAAEICIVVANLAGIGAYLLMARSLSAAGLEYYGSPAKKAIVTMLALAVAIALCYSAIVYALSSIRTNPAAVVSPAADVITFVLVAPLLLTTFALRGGQLFWIFAFLTTGTMGWMVNQGAKAIVTFAGGGDEATRIGRILGFAMACFLIAAAAFTQWLAARRAVRGPGHA